MALERLDQEAQSDPHLLLKAAPVIKNWESLMEGHRWYKKTPQRHSFLPRSKNGRWQWYRLLHANKMPVVFFCNKNQREVLDQPSVLQKKSFYRDYKDVKFFAAILGQPVFSSLTPCEQKEFFSKKNWPVLRIDISEEELNQKTLDFLQHLGLRAAAVTSPLKKKILTLCQPDPLSQKLESVNTICFCEKTKKWLGTNTDLEGLKELTQKASEYLKISEHLKTLEHLNTSFKILIWGGGGTLKTLKEVFPNADLASVRSGQLRNEQPLKPHYNLVVWALSPEYHKFPVLEKRPDLVIDLNYVENSSAKEFCLQWDPPLRYYSGLEMFKKQAEEQRNYWLSKGF